MVILYFLDALKLNYMRSLSFFMLDGQLLDAQAAALSVKLNKIHWKNEQLYLCETAYSSLPP